MQSTPFERSVQIAGFKNQYLIDEHKSKSRARRLTLNMQTKVLYVIQILTPCHLKPSGDRNISVNKFTASAYVCFKYTGRAKGDVICRR